MEGKDNRDDEHEEVPAGQRQQAMQAKLERMMSRMSKDDLLGFMAQQGIAHDASQSEEALRAHLRQTLLRDARGRADRKMQVWRYIIPLAVLFILVRAYSLFFSPAAAAARHGGRAIHAGADISGFDTTDAAGDEFDEL